jgi:hypothetical protein
MPTTPEDVLAHLLEIEAALLRVARGDDRPDVDAERDERPERLDRRRTRRIDEVPEERDVLEEGERDLRDFDERD